MGAVSWKWTPERITKVKELIRRSGTLREVADELGVTESSVRCLCNKERIDYRSMFGRGIEVTAPPPSHLPVKELVEHRKRSFQHLSEHRKARREIPVRVRDGKPIGILHFGDPHIDDDGTDISLLERHARLVRETDGLYGATVGDLTNNWVGRLAKLYAQQGTSAADGWRLAEWFLGEVRDWLYIVGGNHDLWSGSGDPLQWISRQVGALYQESEVRVGLQFPNDLTVRVNCRHDFAGSSQWNPAHGAMKALMMGTRDHLAVCGHKHESAIACLRDPETGIAMWALKVASYKLYDRFALEKGFRDQNLSPCALTVIDPRLPSTHPDLISVWWDPLEGADYLRFLRSRKR